MKKYVVLLLLLGCAVLMPAKGFAFTSVSRTTSTAVSVLSGAGLAKMDIILRNLSDNSTTTQIYWSGVTLPASYLAANAYVQVNSTLTAAGSGIQIYTDNEAADANPTFTLPGGVSPGQAGSNPAGLVDTTTTTAVLSMAWSIKATTTTAPTQADPTSTTDANAAQWLFFEDRNTPTIASQNTTAFADGATFVTIKLAGSGIHFGQANTAFGAAPSPNFVYCEANFGAAVTPRTYKTSTLRLEAFTP